MLVIELPELELFDDETSTFFTIKKQTIQMEHSLLSISKWESKWKKPFLRKEPMTNEERIDYFKCMTITQNVNPDLYKYLPFNIQQQIEDYIDDEMTATWFSNIKKNQLNKEVITSEIIYYWMIVNNIPFECQKWHFNRLLTLIRVCNIKNSKPVKQNRKELLANRAALNKARRAKYNSKG